MGLLLAAVDEVTVAGVPLEIAGDAARQPGLIPLLVSGSARERHDFAKGRPTRFGRMSFDADQFLKLKKGWSEQRIHDTGASLGFSDAWAAENR